MSKKFLVVDYDMGNTASYDVTDGTEEAEAAIKDCFDNALIPISTRLEDENGNTIGYSSLEWSIKVVLE